MMRWEENQHNKLDSRPRAVHSKPGLPYGSEALSENRLSCFLLPHPICCVNAKFAQRWVRNKSKQASRDIKKALPARKTSLIKSIYTQPRTSQHDGGGGVEWHPFRRSISWAWFSLSDGTPSTFNLLSSYARVGSSNCTLKSELFSSGPSWIFQLTFVVWFGVFFSLPWTRNLNCLSGVVRWWRSRWWQSFNRLRVSSTRVC